MNAINLARKHLYQGQFRSAESLAAQVEAEEMRSAFAVPFALWRNGRAFGRLPDGGVIEIERGSNGSVEQGQIILAQKSLAHRAIGRWMPR